MSDDMGKDGFEPVTGDSDPAGEEAAIGRLALEFAHRKPSGPDERIRAARRLADVGVTDPIEVAAILRCGETTAREALAAIDVSPGTSAVRKPTKRTMEAWARRLAGLDTLINSPPDATGSDSFTTRPAAPRVTLSRSRGSTTIRFQLDATGATRYRWKLSTQSNWTELAAGVASGSFTGARGTRITVQAQARNDSGYGPTGSNSIQGAPALPGKPSITDTPSKRSVEVDVSSANAASIDVTLTGGGLGPGGVRKTVNGSGGTVEFTGLSPDTAYTITAVGTNAEDEDGPSATDSGRTLATTPPGPVRIVIDQVDEDSARIRVSSARATRIDVRVGSLGQQGATSYRVNDDDDTRTISGLASGTTYAVTATATNEDSPPDATGSDSFTTDEPAPTVPTFSLRASSGSVIVRQLSADNATRYTAQLSESSSFPSSSRLTLSTTGSQITFQNLTPGTRYYVRANATGPGGTSGWSATDDIVVPLDAPTLSLLAPVAGSITAAVSAVAGATGYRIEISQNQFFSSGVRSATRSSPGSVTFSNLAAGTWYGRARATRGSIVSAWSTRESVTVRSDPGPP
ncbi:MAG: hypothetical protein OXH66_08880 [Gemmatimonadetes bacterium]|nr:hypothetical protein [Gemmatimonadota bacterium]